jgi:hypothetical protein
MLRARTPPRDPSCPVFVLAVWSFFNAVPLSVLKGVDSRVDSTV